MGIILDFAIVLSAAAVAYLGWRLGSIRILVPLIGGVVGFLLASRHYQDLAQHLPQDAADPETLQMISFAAIVLGTFVVAVGASMAARTVLNVMFLGWFDSLGGLMVGLALALLAWAAAIEVVPPYLSEDFQQVVDKAELGRILARYAPQVLKFAPELVRTLLPPRVV